ncbi:tetratricopeptide repeat protein [Mucilaginibacter calamicampi]|uniref:Tetratricopeptide repeat protein n=1 Tax=Mucilaginibacter calamicampi TaxID=1302352 RepID=A0ABW2YW75_9SPHI
MRVRKIIFSVLLIAFITPAAFCQSEVLKGVVNSLARYKEHKELKYLAAAKKSIDSLFVVNSDSTNFEKNVYLTVVNSSVLYVDSLNSLNQPINLLAKTSRLMDKLKDNPKKGRFEKDLSFAATCLANVYMRNGFNYLVRSDIINAQRQFLTAKKFAPAFKQIDAYLAYVNASLGNLPAAASFYDSLADDITADHVEAASAVYKAVGDTAKAIKLLERFRKKSPENNFILLDAANIYNNKQNYTSLKPLLPGLLDINQNNPDIVFVAANCYDRLGEYENAEKLYLKAVELNGAAYDPTFNLGLLYLKKSAQKEGSAAENLSYATAWLEKATEIAPNNINCLEVLRLLYSQTKNKTQLDKVNNKLKQLTN